MAWYLSYLSRPHAIILLIYHESLLTNHFITYICSDINSQIYGAVEI